jgi:hypothetical protein
LVGVGVGDGAGVGETGLLMEGEGPTACDGEGVTAG